MLGFMESILPCLAATEKSTVSYVGQVYASDFYWHSCMFWVGMRELHPNKAGSASKSPAVSIVHCV